MAKEFWLNLPVKNISRSTEFFSALGFKFGNGPGVTPFSVPLLIGSKDVMVMLFEEPTFKAFVNQEIANTDKACEVLLSFGVSSKEEVDEMARRAVAAGGKTAHVPHEMQGMMYGCVFTDLDGHKWNVLYLAKQ